MLGISRNFTLGFTEEDADLAIASNEVKRAELEAVKQYNALVKEFNAVIGSDVREQATLEILGKKSLSSHLVVFTMGVGHRKNYLKLVDVYLKDSKTAFLFITPPELLTNWLLLLGLPLLILLGLLLFGYYF